MWETAGHDYGVMTASSKDADNCGSLFKDELLCTLLAIYWGGYSPQ